MTEWPYPMFGQIQVDSELHIHVLKISKLKASTTSPSEPCGVNDWQCDNLECINYEFLCDGTKDCTDNSDEGPACATRSPGK